MSESKKHQIFVPDAIQATGDSSFGSLNIFYRMKNGETITVVLSPELMTKTIRHIALGAAASPVPNMRDSVQMFAVREISAHLHQAATLTLRYETEVGVALETTIDRADAEKLRDQLAAALDAQPPASGSARH